MTTCVSNFLVARFLAVLILGLLAVGSGERVCYPRRDAVNAVVGEVCYSDDAPFQDLPLPQHVDVITPSYHYVFLGQRNNQQNSSSAASKIIASRLPIPDAGLVMTQNNNNDSQPNEMAIIVHGWVGNWQNTAQWRDPIVKNLLLVKPSIQVIYVEWAVGAAIHFGRRPYAQPASNTRLIGDRLADFFLQSKKRRFENLTNVHCIGFSLGAHVCAFASKRMWAERRIRWGRLTALDPALVHFDKTEDSARLCEDDADFVDVIHTSRMGLERYVGHVDFYPNPPAKVQPGCQWLKKRRRRHIFSGLLDAIESLTTELVSCSHVRAALLFAETILRPPACTFCPCDSMANWLANRCERQCSANVSATLGYWSSRESTSRRGLFFGETASSPPYCGTTTRH